MAHGVILGFPLFALYPLRDAKGDAVLKQAGCKA